MHQKIQDILTSNHITYSEVRHDSFDVVIQSPFDFAKALNYEVERITKSVFLRSKLKDKYIMAVCSAGKKFDLPKLAQLAGVNKLEVAERQELADLVGYPPTGVCTIGLSPDINVFIDGSLLCFETVLTGSGEVGVEIELSPTDIVKLSNATLDSITL